MAHTVTRIFLGWDQPVLPAAAAHIVEHYLDGTVADLRPATLVLPGGRARRRIIELLLDAAELRGATLIPPRATTVGQLPELLLTRTTVVADDVASGRAWSRALRGVDRQALQEVFPHLPESDDMAAWDELAGLLAGLHQSLAAEGHRFGDVVRICSSGLLFDDGARWTVLEQVQRRYLYVLDQAALADRFELRMGALESGSVAFTDDLWLVSVVDLPAVTRRLVETSRANLHVLVHAPAVEDDQETKAPDPRFDDFGIPLTEYWENAAVPVTDTILTVTERPVDQADAVISALGTLGAAYPAEEVVLAVHSESEVVPYLEQRLEARGVPARYAAGTPLTRTAPVRLLQAVADYLDHGSFRSLAALLRHPDADALRGSTDAVSAQSDAALDMPPPVPTQGLGDALEAADRYFTEHLPSSVRGKLPQGSRRAEPFPALARAFEREGPLGRLGGRRPLSDWMEEVMKLLLACYGSRNWDRSRPTHRRLLDALTRIHAVAAALRALPTALNEECRCSAAMRTLIHTLRTEALPPEPRRDAVELLDWLELPLDDAPCVVLTAFNEGFLPTSVIGHPFLPDALRTRLGLTDNRRRLARDSYRLTTLLHSKEYVRLIAGRRSTTGDPLLPSRLMFRIPEEEIPERVLRFLSKADNAEQGASPGPGLESSSGSSLATLGLEPGVRSEFVVPPERVIQLAFEDIPRGLAVTGFKAVLDDPYRFVLEHLYRLDNVHDDAREMDPLRFGSLAHDVLERFGAAALESPPTVDITDASSIETTLLAILAEEVATRFGEATLPAVHIQVEQLAARLRAFAVKQAEWAADGWRIMAVECRPEGSGMPFEVDGTAFLLWGRIDRIDHNPSTGEWAVLDYKTGNSVDPPEKTHRKKRDGELVWVDLQLPLYRRLLAGIVDRAGRRIMDDATLVRNPILFGYISLPPQAKKVAFMLADWTGQELEAAEETAREVIRFLREGRFPFDRSLTKIRHRQSDPLAPLLTVGWQATADDEGADEGADEGISNPDATHPPGNLR